MLFCLNMRDDFIHVIPDSCLNHHHHHHHLYAVSQSAACIYLFLFVCFFLSSSFSVYLSVCKCVCVSISFSLFIHFNFSWVMSGVSLQSAFSSPKTWLFCLYANLRSINMNEKYKQANETNKQTMEKTNFILYFGRSEWVLCGEVKWSDLRSHHKYTYTRAHILWYAPFVCWRLINPSLYA